MIRYVIDAYVAVEYLMRTPLGRKLADLIADAPLTRALALDIVVQNIRMA